MSVKTPNAKSIFKVACSIESAEARDEYLDQACGDDRDLKDRVAVLLRMREEEPDFLESPPVGVEFAERPGMVIGPYELLEQIGEGGMGLVFVARQQEPVQRDVAIKVIKPGMDSRQVIARFEAERQALALMEHPNIAKVLDAGSTESERPYFVMELVRGQPIIKYSDDHRLSIRERLELFSVVCDAVDHAHSRGVIHRDIKPSNVLVTARDGKPAPKVIDFGIAKATQRSLESESIVTKTGQFIGTPQYMSPEQADMSPMDVGPRSDIYSLGVLLYELLTGVTPFDADQLLSAGLDEMRRIMREVDPPRPSVRLRGLDDTVAEVASKRDTDPQTLNRLVAGDLDWITLKALEKDPGSRYATPRGLADDIERFLDNRPILAKRPTLVKRLTKWTQRHRAITASAVLVLLISSGALGLGNLSIRGARDQALMQKTEAERQRVEAEKQLRNATAMRLAAQSQSVRSETAIQSLLLAVEATQVTRCQGESVHPLARESLMGALSVIGGRPLMGEDIPVAIPGPAFSPNGRWMATSSQGEVRLWDLTKPWNSKVVLRGQEATARVAAVSSGGRWIVTAKSGEESREFHLWDLTAADPLTVLHGHADKVLVAQFSPDGRWLATGSRDRKVHLWDLTAEDPGALAEVLPGDVLPRSPAFSRDGRWLATTLGEKGSACARLWDLEANESEPSIVLPMREHEIVAFSPDGRWLATGSSVGGADRSTAVKLWDLTAESPAAAPIEMPGDAVEIEVVAFSPDGRWLVSAGLDSSAHLWDVTATDPASTHVVLRGHVMGIWDAAFSPDSRLLVTAGSDKVARVWNLTAEDPSAVSMVLRGHETRVTRAAFTPDSQWVVTWSTDEASRIWNIAPGKFGLATTEGLTHKSFALPTTPHLLWQQPRVHQVWMIDDGAKFLSANFRGQAALWDVSSSDPWRSAIRLSASKVPGVVSSYGWARPSRDGRWVLQLPREGAVLWDLHAETPASSGQLLNGQQAQSRWIGFFSRNGRWLLNASLGSVKRPWSVPGRQLAFSPDEHWLTAPDWECPLTLWDLDATDSDRQPSVLCGDTQNPSGPFHDLRVWDLRSGSGPAAAKSVVLRGHQSDVTVVAFSYDSRWLATAGADRTVRLWDMQTENPASLSLVLRGPPAPIEEVWFSPDGRWLAASARAGDRWSVHLWDSSDDEFRTRPFHLPGQCFPEQFPPKLPPFSPDSKRLLTISAEGPVRLWDLTAEDPSAAPAVLRGHVGTPLAAAFSPDGRWLATGGAINSKLLLRDETVRLWNLSSPNTRIDCVVLRGYSSRCSAVTFTADSHHLVTRRSDGEVRVWELRLEKLIQLARRTAGRQLTSDEREKYMLPTTP